VLDELEAAPDGPARVAVWPRLANAMIDFMVENRDLLLLHSRNRSAFEQLTAHRQGEHRDLEARFERIIASPAIPLRERVRMAAMVGAITEVFAESAGAFADDPPGEVADLVREAVATLFPAEASQPAAPPVRAARSDRLSSRSSSA
jgi:hypothetical protein